MSNVEHDPYDTLSCEELLREVVSEDGYVALMAHYGGQILYVNSLFDPAQFRHVLAEEDAKNFVRLFSGEKIPLPSAREDLRLLIGILFMQGYSGNEIALACKCAQSYVYQSIRRLIADHPEITAIKDCYNVNKKDVVNAAPHNRWASIHRNSFYLKFLAQIDQVPYLRKRSKSAFARIKVLKNCLPVDPCRPPVRTPWRKAGKTITAHLLERQS